MRRFSWIGLLFLLALAACDTTTHEARRMVKRAERLADTLPDSTARLIDSVLHMPVSFGERERMDMALLQAEALFGCRGGSRNGSTISPVMDDEFFDDHGGNISTSTELERAAAYYGKKKQYTKAAHAALYSGFVQQHYNEKETAMRSFKDAERFGEIAGDNYTSGQAEYWIGKLLYEDGMAKEALSMLEKSETGFDGYYIEKALAQNMLAICNLILGNYDCAEMKLQKSLWNSEKSGFNKVKRRVLNNFAVLYRQQGRYDLTFDYLKQTVEGASIDDEELFMFYLNMGKTFMVIGSVDSAAVYYQRIENLLSTVQVKDETKVSAYGALSRFAKTIKNDSLALQYREMHGNLLYEVMHLRQEQAVYRIQKQFDYETLQNKMNWKIIHRHRIILVISMLLLFSFIVIMVLQYREKQMRVAEEEMKQQIVAMKEDLRKTVKTTVLDNEVASRLRMMLLAKNAISRSDNIKKEWKPLITSVMNGKDNLFEGARISIETVYPNLYQTIIEKYPDLTDTEAKVCLLSCIDLSNMEMAELLGLRLNTVNQNRSTLRKKLNLKSEKMSSQLRDVFSH